jgi:hypothetical protein
LYQMGCKTMTRMAIRWCVFSVMLLFAAAGNAQYQRQQICCDPCGRGYPVCCESGRFPVVETGNTSCPTLKLAEMPLLGTETLCWVLFEDCTDELSLPFMAYADCGTVICRCVSGLCDCDDVQDATQKSTPRFGPRTTALDRVPTGARQKHLRANRDLGRSTTVRMKNANAEKPDTWGGNLHSKITFLRYARWRSKYFALYKTEVDKDKDKKVDFTEYFGVRLQNALEPGSIPNMERVRLRQWGGQEAYTKSSDVGLQKSFHLIGFQGN